MTNSKSTGTEKYSAPALSKGLDILELLASSSTGMKKSEIAKNLDRSISEIFRMLAVLTERGYINIDETTEQYTLTLKMFEVAHRYPPVKRLTNIAADFMAKLADSLNQSVHLAVLNGGDILIIAQNDPPGNNITSVRLGARIPAPQTSSGAALCCDFSQQQLDAICNEAKNAPKEQLKMFRENVAQAAEFGVIISPSMVIAGVKNISVPIKDYSGQIVASLTIPYIQRLVATQDPDVDAATLAMVETGKNMSKLLGASVT